jgi:hypothetical protein
VAPPASETISGTARTIEVIATGTTNFRRIEVGNDAIQARLGIREPAARQWPLSCRPITTEVPLPG